MQEILKVIEKLKRDIAALEKLVTEQSPPAPKPAGPADEERKATAVRIMEFFNSECNSSFSTTAKCNMEPIVARLKQGRSFEDFILVISDRKQKWGEDPKMCEYLRPSTLFAPTNFENYLNIAKKDAAHRKNSSFKTNEVEDEIFRRLVG